MEQGFNNYVSNRLLYDIGEKREMSDFSFFHNVFFSAQSKSIFFPTIFYRILSWEDLKCYRLFKIALRPISLNRENLD